MPRYTTKQTSGDSTIDCYWNLVNNRYRDIYNKHPFAFDKNWADGAISDANYGIRYCDIILKDGHNHLLYNYKCQFMYIIKQLELLKQSMPN